MRRGAGEEVKDNQLFVWSSTLINKYLLTINGQNYTQDEKIYPE